MNWIGLKSYIIRNAEIQDSLDSYLDENEYPKISSSGKKRSEKREVNDNDEYQQVLIEDFEFPNVDKKNKVNSNVSEELNNDYQSNLLNYGLKLPKNNRRTKMSDSNDIQSLKERAVQNIYGAKIIHEKNENKILIHSDGMVSLLDRICPYCNHSDANIKDTKPKTFIKYDGTKEKYKAKLYQCNKCGEYFSASLENHVTKETKEEIKLDETIEKIHAKTGLSFDKITEILKDTKDIHVSHTYIQNIIEQPVEGLDYSEELVVLPQDFKINGKTSKSRKVTDCTIVHMLKRNDMEISGDAIADELFLSIMKNNYYLVTILDQHVPDMPIGIAILKTRDFKAMKTFFDFVFENKNFEFLTSDMLNVYEAIATDNKIPHQQCIFHSMKHVGKILFDELKKKGKYTTEDIIWFCILLTEYREILREYDYEEAINKKKNFITKINKYLKNGELPKVFSKIIKHLNRRFKKLTTHLREDNIDRTSNKCETFNSLPQVTRLKKICKSPKALLFRLGSIIKNYTPNFRTLQNRNKYQKQPT
jgi:hypothetical protein